MASIEKRGKNSYRLVVEAGSAGNRDKETKTVRCKGITEARLELAKFVAEVESGLYIKPEKMTLEAFYPKWYENYAIKELSSKTRFDYEKVYLSRIKPEFGTMQLSDITPLHILDFVKKMEQPGMRKLGDSEKPLSSSSVQFAYRVLRNILERAKKWKVTSSNPASDVKRPKAIYKKAQVYERVEAEVISAAIIDQMPLMWQCLYLGAFLGGFRRGELVGLQWSSVFFLTNQIFVERSIPFTLNKEPQIKAPKTNASLDFVEMPVWYMDLLKEWHEQYLIEKEDAGSEWAGKEGEDFVFHSGYGKPYYFQHPSKRWTMFLNRNGFRVLPFHSLRHTMVSLLLEENFSLTVVRHRTRHAHDQTTANIYGHLTKKSSHAMAAALDILNPLKKSVPNPSPIEKMSESDTTIFET